MNRYIHLAAFPALLVFLLSACTPAPAEHTDAFEVSPSCELPPTRHCSIFTISLGDRVFFAGNDDYIDREGYYWVDPGGATGYGAIYLGRPDNVQQGFNERGLAYDSNGLPEVPVHSHPGSEPVSGGYTSYPIQILRECATVEEVIAWVQEHRWHTAMIDQLHFADASGDAVVISAGPNGEVAFTRKPAGDGYLVSTNFNLANPSNGKSPCWRYTLAERMLQEIKSQDELTAERAASILDAVHIERSYEWTKISMVADLPQGMVYVYLFHQFDDPIALDVAEEIARAPAPGPLSDLFPPETVAKADVAYQRLTAGAPSCNTAAYLWLGLVVVSLVAWSLLARRRRRDLFPWIPVVVVLGPLGLLVWVIAGRSHSASGDGDSPGLGAEPAQAPWRRAVMEVAGDLPPYVVGMMIAMLIMVLVPALNQDTGLQLLVYFGLPLVISLLLYQGPLLTRANRSRYLRTVLHRFPATLVSANMALTGFMAVTLPLMVRSAIDCRLNALSLLSLWPFTLLGALVGGLLVYAYHAWAIRRGFAVWSIPDLDVSQGQDSARAISSPSWRQIWLWILLSFIALAAGIGLGAIAT
jgi:hypothetical protein